MPDVNLINTNLHNIIVKRDISDAERLDKVTRLLQMGADPFAIICIDDNETGEKRLLEPAFLTALKRDRELVVDTILKYGIPKNLSSAFPNIDNDGLSEKLDIHRANWCHIAALNTSPDCLQLVKEHQNAHFPRHSFKSAINRKFYHYFSNIGWKHTTIGSVLLRRISFRDARFASSIYGDTNELEEFFSEWMFCGPTKTPNKTINPKATIVVKGALPVLRFLLQSGLRKDIADHEGCTLLFLAEKLYSAFSDVTEFAKIEGELMFDGITRTSKVLLLNGAIAFAIRVKNFLGAHEVKLQMAIQYKDIAHCVKNTVEEAADAVQHLEVAVADIREDLIDLRKDVAELQARVKTLEVKLAATAKEQYDAALKKYPVGSQYRAGFQELQLAVSERLGQIKGSQVGIYSTALTQKAQAGLGAVSLFSLAGQATPAAAAFSVLQLVMQAVILYNSENFKLKRAKGVAKATFETDTEPHLLATAIADGLMQMAKQVYGPAITEVQKNQMMKAIISAINSQIDTIHGKQFADADALVCYLAQKAAAHLQAEKVKLQSGATVVEFSTTRKSGSSGSNGSGKKSSTSNPVKGSEHLLDNGRELFPQLGNGTPPNVVMHAHKEHVANQQTFKAHKPVVTVAPPKPLKKKSSLCVIS